MTTNTNTGVQNPATPSEGTKAQSSVMPAALGPRFCIQRDDNTVVPLIPIDELPESVVLKGVPVTLTMLEALKAKLELVPEIHPAHGVRYQLEQPINAQAMGSEQGSDSGSDGSPTSEGSESPTQKGNNNAKDQTLRQPTLTTNDTSIIDTMAKQGTMGKKVYCTYWIQTGNCNYMQEGCKYKHEIPKDEETRRAIGFREFPNWPREELPIQSKPAPALHKSWRRQDGKHEGSGGPGRANRAASSPAAAARRAPNVLARGNSQATAGSSAQAHATAHPTPNVLARGNSQATAGASAQVPAANPHYNPSAAVFTAPQQHFPNQVSHMAQQRLFSQGGQPFLGNGAAENFQHRPAQNNTLPPSYNQSASQANDGGRSGSSTPPKQPPISRPTNVGQSPVGQQQNNNAPSVRRVAPDHHIVTKVSGASGIPSTAQNNARPVYSGMPNNWNPQTNAPTSMDISFIAPPSADSTRSGSQALYTPNYTSSASATPTPNVNNAFSNLNGNTTSDGRVGTPAHNNGNSFANNGNVPVVKGRGPVQYGRNSPAPSHSSARNPVQAFTAADESDATSITSPPVYHRVLFREPGQSEFVTNPPEPKNKVATGPKKHAKKSHAANKGKSAQSKMSGNGYDLLGDVNDQQ